jgi:hypothetical protein
MDDPSRSTGSATNSRQVQRRWFERGHAAFCRSFPHVAAQIPFSPFYVCPQCLTAYSEGALAARLLTREHVPPHGIGGRRLLLTCARCNHRAGETMDADMLKEADFHGFLSGRRVSTRAILKVPDGRVPVSVESGDGTVSMFAVPSAVRPEDSAAVIEHFRSMPSTVETDEHNFQLSFRDYRPAHATASWLRAG